MDWINMLSDDLLLKILSFVTTKDAVATSLLSKRWCSLWKHVPNLTYWEPNYRDPNTEFWRPSLFVDKFLLLNKAPVLETIWLILGRNCRSTHVQTWINLAISRGVRNLFIFRYRPASECMRLPRSLYTCETLVTLNLTADFIVDYVPLTICFRSLKVLTLYLVKFSSDEMVGRLFSGCPVLEDLRVVRGTNDNVKTFTISVPSLRRLTVIDDCGSHVPGDNVGFVTNAPSLKSLTIATECSWCYSFVKMPYLVKADIKLPLGDYKKFEGWIISAKHLSLCLQPPMDSCPIGIFNQLVSLSLCTCSLDWYHLILRHAPKLRVLVFKLKQVRHYQYQDPLQICSSGSVYVQTQLEQPGSVPQCLISSLETVEWIDYKGTQVEKKVVMYLLENSRQLKTMTIRSLVSTNDTEKVKMLQELSSIQIKSTSKCRLLFT